MGEVNEMMEGRMRRKMYEMEDDDSVADGREDGEGMTMSQTPPSLLTLSEMNL
jgi:hypothetical protein